MWEADALALRGNAASLLTVDGTPRLEIEGASDAFYACMAGKVPSPPEGEPVPGVLLFE